MAGQLADGGGLANVGGHLIYIPPFTGPFGLVSAEISRALGLLEIASKIQHDATRAHVSEIAINLIAREAANLRELRASYGPPTPQPAHALDSSVTRT